MLVFEIDLNLKIEQFIDKFNSTFIASGCVWFLIEVNTYKLEAVFKGQWSPIILIQSNKAATLEMDRGE